jgi:hypothetical protein
MTIIGCLIFLGVNYSLTMHHINSKPVTLPIQRNKLTTAQVEKLPNSKPQKEPKMNIKIKDKLGEPTKP